MNKPKRYSLTSQFDKEIKGNAFDFIGKCDAICITINLYFKDGKNIMGAGIAKEARDRYPGIDNDIAFTYENFGNTTHILRSECKGVNCTKIICFPTKPAYIRIKNDWSNVLPYYKYKAFLKPGKDVPGYMGYSDIELIKKSAFDLKVLIEVLKWTRVILPKPGCSHGGLKWEEVKEELKEIGLYQMDAVQFIEKG